MANNDGLLPFLESDLYPNVTDKFDNYRRIGSYLTPETMRDTLIAIQDQVFKHSGYGGQYNILQNFLSRIDRLGSAYVPPNYLHRGYTFITRPHLNLSSLNLRQDSVLRTIASMNKNSVSFMIRALLDTTLCNQSNLVSPPDSMNQYLDDNTDGNFSLLAASSGLVDVLNPFFTPLMNGMTDISGYGDTNLEVETTEGDFHSSDWSFARGSDLNKKTVEFTLNFNDIQGSVLLSIFHIWIRYIALQALGVVTAYDEDIYERRLNYTVSIYRFATDPSKRYITQWSKATGCFPRSVPIGAIFNINQGETFVSSAKNFSIPFTVNHISYQDPMIIMDFRRLVRRYCAPYDPDDTNTFIPVPHESSRNFEGIPWITPSEKGLEMKFMTNDRYMRNREVSEEKQKELLAAVSAEQQRERERLLAIL